MHTETVRVWMPKPGRAQRETAMVTLDPCEEDERLTC